MYHRESKVALGAITGGFRRAAKLTPEAGGTDMRISSCNDGSTLRNLRVAKSFYGAAGAATGSAGARRWVGELASGANFAEEILWILLWTQVVSLKGYHYR